MASDPDAVSEDPDALKQVAALGEQRADTIEALMGDDSASASADKRADQEEVRAATRTSSARGARPERASKRASTATKAPLPSTGNNNDIGNSDSNDRAFDAGDGDDAAFGFGFSSIGDAQQDELYSEPALEHSGPVSTVSGDAVRQSTQQTHTTSTPRVGVAPDNDRVDLGSVPVTAAPDTPATPAHSLGAAVMLDEASLSMSATTTSAKRPAPPPSPMSPTQPFSWNDILRVQNMIERCLQQYLSKTEILLTLKDQAQVDPEFTNVVWQKLQEQNPSFFQAYGIQLQLKEQILAFNYLVAQQKEIMQSGRRCSSSLTALSLPTLLRDSPTNTADKLFSQALQQQQLLSSSQSQGQVQGSMPFSVDSSSSSSNNNNNCARPASSDSILPLPSPIKTDLDTHAFFT